MSGVAVCWFVGLTTLDVVHRAATPPGRNQKITATRQDVAAGGPAANAAVTAAALGARAVLITALGQSPVAAAARADLAAHGVEIVDVADPGFELAVSAVLVDEDTGERSVVSPDGALARAPAPTASVLAGLPRPDAVLFDGHHPEIARAVLAFVAPEGPTSLPTALRPSMPVPSMPVPPMPVPPTGSRHPAAGARRPLVVLDCGRWRPIFADLLPRADVAALSDDFRVPATATAPTATAATATATADTGTAAAVLAMGARVVVVTHGPAPIEWHSADGGSGTVPVPATDARDTLGAGDAFHGALTATLATGKPLPAAITRAAAVATARVAVIGPRTWLSHLDQFRLVVG